MSSASILLLKNKRESFGIKKTFIFTGRFLFRTRLLQSKNRIGWEILDNEWFWTHHLAHDELCIKICSHFTWPVFDSFQSESFNHSVRFNTSCFCLINWRIGLVKCKTILKYTLIMSVCKKTGLCVQLLAFRRENDNGPAIARDIVRSLTVELITAPCFRFACGDFTLAWPEQHQGEMNHDILPELCGKIFWSSQKTSLIGKRSIRSFNDCIARWMRNLDSPINTFPTKNLLINDLLPIWA